MNCTYCFGLIDEYDEEICSWNVLESFLSNKTFHNPTLNAYLLTCRSLAGEPFPEYCTCHRYLRFCALITDIDHDGFWTEMHYSDDFGPLYGWLRSVDEWEHGWLEDPNVQAGVGVDLFFLDVNGNVHHQRARDFLFQEELRSAHFAVEIECFGTVWHLFIAGAYRADIPCN
jgi:hypothetical protein